MKSANKRKTISHIWIQGLNWDITAHSRVRQPSIAITKGQTQKLQKKMQKSSLEKSYYLVGPADQIKIIFLQKLHQLIGPKSTWDPSIALAPPIGVRAWVWPEHIAQQPIIWYLSGPLNLYNLLQVLQLWWKPAMHAKHLPIDQCCNWEAVEAVAEDLPEAHIEAAFTLIIEAVDTVNLGILVVSTQQKDLIRVLYFVGQEEADCLQRLLPAVHVVTQEEVTWGWRVPTLVKEAEKVHELAVYIALNFRWVQWLDARVRVSSGPTIKSLVKGWIGWAWATIR